MNINNFNPFGSREPFFEEFSVLGICIYALTEREKHNHGELPWLFFSLSHSLFVACCCCLRQRVRNKNAYIEYFSYFNSNHYYFLRMRNRLKI